MKPGARAEQVSKLRADSQRLTACIKRLEAKLGLTNVKLHETGSDEDLRKLRETAARLVMVTEAPAKRMFTPLLRASHTRARTLLMPCQTFKPSVCMPKICKKDVPQTFVPGALLLKMQSSKLQSHQYGMPVARIRMILKSEAWPNSGQQ